MEPQLRKWVGRFALPGVFTSLAVPVLLMAFGEPQTASEVVWEIFAAALYSLFNGLFLATGTPLIWMRSKDWALWPRRLARVATVLIGSALGSASANLLLIRIPGHHATGASFWRSYPSSLLMSAVVVGVFSNYELYKFRLETTRTQLQEQELERERALKLATEARLSSLESRVHPHFLFNTLNSVASLIHDDPKGAETMVNQLAQLLRFSLDSAQSGVVPLERELKIVTDFLAIEQARFGERLRYSINVAPRLALTPVPPLSVQTLVENSVKYAVSSRMRGATIRVSAQIEKESLRLLVADDGPGFSCPEIPIGHGLNNLEERLAALYGEKGKLYIESSAGGGTAVTICIPLSVAKAA